MSAKQPSHQSATVHASLEAWEETRKILNDYATRFEDLALKCQANEASKRVALALAAYNADRFDLVVIAGKRKVGKSNLICGILDEPDSLLVHPTAPYLYKILYKEEKPAPSLTELDDEPIDDLVNLRQKGYQTLTLAARTRYKWCHC